MMAYWPVWLRKLQMLAPVRSIPLDKFVGMMKQNESVDKYICALRDLEYFQELPVTCHGVVSK